MKKGGVGGGHTRTGILFEEEISIKDLIRKIPNYRIDNEDIYFGNDHIASHYSEYLLYTKFLKPQGINFKDYISSQLLPDEAILTFEKNTLHILEIKTQGRTGSVDEKLQTCDFKKKQYRKLLSPLKIDIEYAYVLDKWFQQDKYKDVLEYIESVGCYYFFKEVPLSFLGLPTP